MPDNDPDLTRADLTRQDEDMSAVGFGEDETLDRHDFGNWPEVAGVIFTALVLWLMFAFTG
ncbi:hypothetical protein [Radicibacter daui]|uniref:hypothetical protein n=1 Tax=Radicibacter daui TaxID=3064829 RepID=UPI004046B92A